MKDLAGYIPEGARVLALGEGFEPLESDLREPRGKYDVIVVGHVPIVGAAKVFFNNLLNYAHSETEFLVLDSVQNVIFLNLFNVKVLEETADFFRCGLLYPRD